MTAERDAAPYTLRSIQNMLGVTSGVVSGLIDSGFVTPSRGTRSEYRFTFQDVVVLRTAVALQAAAIPARKLLRSLRRLRGSLPDSMPLSGLRITAVGSEVAVRQGGAQWEADGGQFLLDFEVMPSAGALSMLDRPRASALPQAPDADACFAQAEQHESSDPAAAEAGYRRALALRPGHVGAAINLGALLCESGRCAEAVALYAQAIGHCPDEPLLHYNRAIALEDQGEPWSALDSYAACLKLAPEMADAHYNAARLHDQLGDARNALRHFSAYRRLQT